MRTYLSFFPFCGLQITIAQPLQHVVPEQAHPTPRIYTEHYYKRFIQFMDEAPISNKDIVMLGNSLTETVVIGLPASVTSMYATAASSAMK